jgi:hypothetical protein
LIPVGVSTPGPSSRDIEHSLQLRYFYRRQNLSWILFSEGNEPRGLETI